MQMKYNEVKYTRRFNLGDYEHEEFSLACVPDEDETGSEVLLELKEDVIKAFKGTTETKEIKKNAKSKTSNTKDGDEDRETSSEKTKRSNGKSSKDDDSSNSEANDDDNDTSKDAEGSDTEAEENNDEEKLDLAKSGKEKNKKFKKKPSHYDRSIEQHKEVFSRVLRSLNPDWKNSEASKKKAKKASESLEGEPFLDGDGEVEASFKTRLRKLLK